MGNNLKIPCGENNNLNKVPIEFKEKKITRGLINLKFNPVKRTKKIVYMKNITKPFDDENLKNKQILLSFYIDLITPEELTLDLTLKIGRIDSEKSFSPIDDYEIISNIILNKKNPKYKRSFLFTDNQSNFIWGGFEEILNKSKKENIILRNLYNQNYQNIENIKNNPNSQPYHLFNDENKEMFVDEECLNLFKKYISENILKKINYYYLTETMVNIKEKKGKGNINLIFNFEIINFEKTKLKEEYKNLEMVVK